MHTDPIGYALAAPFLWAGRPLFHSVRDLLPQMPKALEWLRDEVRGLSRYRRSVVTEEVVSATGVTLRKRT
jgi:hypothetical protein